jgi:hypothetical protein
MHNLQEGETVRDFKKQYKIFGKALGRCTCEFGNNYPMFNYEKCPKINYRGN